MEMLYIREWAGTPPHRRPCLAYAPDRTTPLRTQEWTRVSQYVCVCNALGVSCVMLPSEAAALADALFF